jgi:hypothetical protein
MKKIIALAVAGAFSVPVMAADVTIGGDMEFTYLNGEFMADDGAIQPVTTTDTDGDVNIKASAELANGMTVSADFNLNEVASGDGGESLTIAGQFGSIDMGDANSAADSIDDVTDWGLALTRGTGSSDAAINWTLPTFVDGLSVYVSHSPEGSGDEKVHEKVSGGDANDSVYFSNSGSTAAKIGGNNAGGGTNSDSFAVKYNFGMGSVGYAKTQDGSSSANDETLVNLSVSTAGITASYEAREQDNGTLKIAGVTTATNIKETAVGLTYTTGDITIGYESVDVTATGVTKQDFTAFGVHYAMGDVILFAETSEESEEKENMTAIGATFKF